MFERSNPRVFLPVRSAETGVNAPDNNKLATAAGSGVNVPDNNTLATYLEIGCEYGVVHYDRTSPTCESAANYVVKTIDGDIDRLGTYFRVDPSSSKAWWHFYMVPGGGGAVHFGCGSKYLFIGADTPNPFDAKVAEMLTVAEVVEVFEAGQESLIPAATGWHCDNSVGEGLSRVLAEELMGSAPIDPKFLVANAWLSSPRANFVDNTLFTDTNSVANGCAVLFLNWLRFA